MDGIHDMGGRHGFGRVEIELEGTYKGGRHGVEAYLRQTALANPHVLIRYKDPKGEVTEFSRATDSLPEDAEEIKPHPYGVELGRLVQMLKNTKQPTISQFLGKSFSRVSPAVGGARCSDARTASGPGTSKPPTAASSART